VEPIASRRRGRARTAGRILTGLVGAALVILATAAPASAHGLGGPTATDQRVVVEGVVPGLVGVQVRTVDLGSRIELTNRGTIPVIVLGYEGEPYLRIGPQGVEENRRSPATALNRRATPSGPRPPGLDATAEPRWVRTSGEPVARWHDHRAHWMGRGSVRDLDWSIPVRRGPTAAEIRGTITSEPAPNLWVWLGAAAAAAAVTVLAARGRHWPAALAVGLVVLAASETVHVLGAWGAWEATAPRRLVGAAPSLLAITTCVGALALLVARRRSPDAATPVALLAGLFTALAGGLADLGSLTHAIPPSTLAPPVVRVTVTIALGVGVGVAVVASRHLRPVAAPVAGPARPVSG
jgi:hypothetical protein